MKTSFGQALLITASVFGTAQAQTTLPDVKPFFDFFGSCKTATLHRYALDADKIPTSIEADDKSPSIHDSEKV